MEKKDNRGGRREGAGRKKGPVGPYKEVIRDKQLTLRLTQGELDTLAECAEMLGTTRANTIVKAVKELHEKLKK